MRFLTVVGARPQLIKAAMVSRAILQHNRGSDAVVDEVIVHTGQHYDRNMSQIFFEELAIPAPAVNIGVRAERHGEMTGRMLVALEREIAERRPDWVLVYGDTNSTLAGALAAAKLQVPVAHIEAGLRSFNRRMPEEVNRVLTDHVATLLFCPTARAVDNLALEGITSGVHHVGDVMYDAALVFGEVARRRSVVLGQLGLEPQGYYLATIHRAENTDAPGRLAGIMEALDRLSRERPVLLPLHPRTRKRLVRLDSSRPGAALRIIEPVSYLDMVRLEQEAKAILTDSGGVQKEALFHGVPCVTLREETEWVETVAAGWNQVVGADADAIVAAAHAAAPGSAIDQYGCGDSATRIVARLRAGVPGALAAPESRRV